VIDTVPVGVKGALEGPGLTALAASEPVQGTPVIGTGQSRFAGIASRDRLPAIAFGRGS